MLISALKKFLLRFTFLHFALQVVCHCASFYAMKLACQEIGVQVPISKECSKCRRTNVHTYSVHTYTLTQVHKYKRAHVHTYTLTNVHTYHIYSTHVL